jgi:hypothetical protein
MLGAAATCVAIEGERYCEGGDRRCVVCCNGHDAMLVATRATIIVLQKADNRGVATDVVILSSLAAMLQAAWHAATSDGALLRASHYYEDERTVLQWLTATTTCGQTVC